MTKITDVSENSSSSANEESQLSRVKNFAKHMLKGSLFIGTFQEKRFVKPLDSYRDVIKVADDETDLIDNLIAVRKRLTKFYSKESEDVWIGITEPKTIGAPTGYNLWVSLNTEVFGSYWYKIKTVEFHSSEVCVRLEVVRPVSKDKTSVHNVSAQQMFEDISKQDVRELATTVSNYFKERIVHLFSETLTYSNVKQAVIFMLLLISTLVTFLIHAVKYLLDYILKLLHEFSGLVKVSTPIIVNFMKLVSNLVNGFYNLIAVLWRDRSRPKVNQNLYQIMPPYENMGHFNAYRALPYPEQGVFPNNKYYRKSYRPQVEITPLD